ncbi:MAG: homoserine kinase, partial [Chloroflexota bacterium]
ANLGAGFDCLGLALGLYNIIGVEPARALDITVEGEGATTLPRHAGNRVVRAMQRACDALREPLPTMRLRMTNNIPLARGLGSSAAASVGGLLAANHWYGDRLTIAELLALATELEGHPDNVAPALLGGMCVVTVDDGKPIAVPIVWPASLRFIVYVPDTPLPTAQARAVLPPTVTRADAVFNVGRAALWVAAITQQRFDLIAIATQDRLHQRYRATLIAGFDAIITAAMTAGARGAFLSGAGSSIAAIADTAHDQIANAMLRAADAAGQTGRMLRLDCDPQGARVQA